MPPDTTTPFDPYAPCPDISGDTVRELRAVADWFDAAVAWEKENCPDCTEQDHAETARRRDQWHQALRTVIAFCHAREFARSLDN